MKKNTSKIKSKLRNKTKKNVNNLQITCNSFSGIENKKDFKNITLTEGERIDHWIKILKKPFAPTAHKSTDDFYTWINYSWIVEQTMLLNKEDKFYAQIDSFRVIQEKVYYELINIVKKYIQTNNNPLSIEINNLYTSMKNLEDQSSIKHVKRIVSQIDQIIEEDDLYKLLGELNNNEIISWGAPIVWGVLPDQKNSKIYKSTISAPQLSAYDYMLYIEDVEEDQNTKMYRDKFKREFLKYVEIMFKSCLGANHGLKAFDVWNIEIDMMMTLGCNMIKTDSQEGYNVLNQEDGLKYGFDWGKFAKNLNYKKIPKTFICTSTNFLKCMMTLLNKKWKSQEFRTYYIYMNLRQIIRFNKKWKMIHYNFHGKFVQGLRIPWPDEIYPVFGLSFAFNTFLTTQYVIENPKVKEINYVKALSCELTKVFKRIIKQNTWLSKNTKKYALLKLEHLNIIIGKPDILREDPLLGYDKNDAYGNMLKLAYWRTNNQTELENKSIIDVPIIDWEKFKFVGTQPYVVNAYYTPTNNSIYIPLAYLQKPFIDLDDRGIEYNLAYIGYTLGHEMSHALDDMGSKYDYKGNLHNWWTDEDRQKFNKKVQDVINQYETFAGYDGIQMDASLSTGENLADISGMAICENYLMDFQINNQDTIPIRSLSFKSFYTYLAVQARQKIYKDAIKAQLKTNPHPLDKYRTNCPLARLKLFNFIYNIKKGDKMYWENKDTIW